jgi:hypothetical protein
MADDPYESTGCFFAILLVACLFGLLVYGVYYDINHPRFVQLVCRSQGKVTEQSKTYRSDRIYKSSDSSDWVVGSETYNPRPGESCKAVEVKTK